MDFDEPSESSLERSLRRSNSFAGEDITSPALENVLPDPGFQSMTFEIDDQSDLHQSQNVSMEEECHHQSIGNDVDRPQARRGRVPGCFSQRLGAATNDEYRSNDSTHSRTNLQELVVMDRTMLSRLLADLYTKKSPYEEDSVEVTVKGMVKHISLFAPEVLVRQTRDSDVWEMMQQTLEQIASHAMAVQQALEDSCLTTSVDNPESIPLCRGVRSVHVDSNLNLVGEIDVDPCAVSLYDIIVFTSQPLRTRVVVSLLKLIIVMVDSLHEAGFVHGCLHGGNVMCCTDNGHTIFSGVGGVMSNLLFPADPSFISPHLATAMRPIVDSVWNSETMTELGKDGLYPWASVEHLHDVVLSLYGVDSEKDFQPVAQPRDDVYAIGILALTCLLGVPPFHGHTLKEVVDTLTMNEDGIPTNPDPAVLVGSVFSTAYARRRFSLAGYEDTFIDDVRDFVLLCLDTEKFMKVSAAELLNHRLFANYPLDPSGNNDTENWEEEKNTIDDALHRVVYPVYRTMECVRNGCGTTPMLLRAYRNTIFAARWDSLQSSWFKSSETGDDDGVKSDSVSVLWPYIDKAISVWGEHLPETKVNIRINETEGSSLLYKSKIKNTSNCKTLEEVAQSKDMITNMDEQSLVYQGKTHTCLALLRDELPKDHYAKILILRDLQNCEIEILAPFQYVVLKNVRNCDVVLGPCHVCYCDHIMDTTFAVAAGHLLLDCVKRVGLQYSGVMPPYCRDTSSLSEICVSPLKVAYPGMSSDFAACHLPQEHAGTVQFALRADESCGFDSVNTHIMGPLQRDLVLRNVWRTGFDYPYSHALAAFSSLFIHQDDNTSDVFLHGDVAGKNINISRICGDSQSAEECPLPPKCSHFSSDVTRHPFWSSQRPTMGNNELKKPICPVIFILDPVSDCVIEDCSRCTVFIAASMESVVMRRCSHMRLFLMSKELVIQDCEFIDVHLFVVDFLFMRNCSHIELFPFALSAPRVEELIEEMINSCADGSQREMLHTAFNKKDIGTLDVLFRRSSDASCMSTDNCDEIHINDRSAVMIVVDFVQSQDPPSRFFYEAYRGRRTMADWVHAPFIERSWGFSADRQRREILRTPRGMIPIPRNQGETSMNDSNNGSWISEHQHHQQQQQLLLPVRFHDFIKASILRLPGTISGRAGSGQLVDVVLERISTGVVHLAEAVGILWIRRCTGPLSIVVCAARCVFLEECEHVTLQTACGSLTAKNCHSCHFALHINTPPRYIGCSSLCTSTLNITSEDFEGFLDRAGVEQQTNHFHSPYVQATETEESLSTVCTPSAGSAADNADVNTLAKALAILWSPIFVVPPLPGMCVGVRDAAFLDFLEDPVNSERKRVGFDERMISALSFLSRPRLAASLCVEPREGIASEESPQESSAQALTGVVSPILHRHIDPLNCEERISPMDNSPHVSRKQNAVECGTEETQEEKDNTEFKDDMFRDDHEEEKEEYEDEDEDDGHEDEEHVDTTDVHSEIPLPARSDGIVNSFIASTISCPSIPDAVPSVQSNVHEEREEAKTNDEVNTETNGEDAMLEHNSSHQSITPVEQHPHVQDTAYADDEDILTLCARSKECDPLHSVDAHLCPTEAKQVSANDDATAQRSVTEESSFPEVDSSIDLATYRSIPAGSLVGDQIPSSASPSGDGEITDTERRTTMLWGKLIAHSDEEEMFQDILMQVEAARARFLTAKSKFNFSRGELEQRVRNAVERIQSVL